jgi:hypothetical protein
MIRFTCPSCGMVVSAPEDCAGRLTKCRNCNNSLVVPHLAPHWAVQPPQPKTAPSLSTPPPLESLSWDDTPEPPVTVKKAAPFLALTLALMIFSFVGWLMWKFSSPLPPSPNRNKQFAKAAPFTPKQEKNPEQAASEPKTKEAALLVQPPPQPIPYPLPPKQEELPEKAPPESKMEEPPPAVQVQTPEPQEKASPATQPVPPAEVAAQRMTKKMKTTSPQTPAYSATKDPNETKNNPPIDADTLTTGRHRGTLISTPNEGGLFRVAVEYQRIRVKLGKQADYDRIQRDMINLLGTAAGERVRALTGSQLTPLTRQGKVPDWHDRLMIAGASGRSEGASVEFEALKARLIELLETTQDTQSVTFHAAPQIQVRVLRPSAGTTAESQTAENPKKGQVVLPGYAGALTDLKIGQRILLTLVPSRNVGKQKGVAPQSIYRQLVTLVIVEEEPEHDSLSK